MTLSDQPAGLLGIDLGTASVKVVWTRPDGTVLASAQRPYDVEHAHPGWSETPPEQWWRAVGDAVREVVATSPAPPLAIGLSGQMHGVVLTGHDHEPVRPAMLWSDSRAAAETAAYTSLPAADRARLANPVVPGMAGPQLAWVARHEPDVLARTRWALQPKDWLRLRLTGAAAGEPSDASGTLLYDLVADDWDRSVADALAFSPDLLPPLLSSAGSPAGRLTPEAAAHLGLPEGVPVAAGGADTAVAMLGTGLHAPGQVQLTIGTGIQVVTPLDRLPHPLVEQPAFHTYRTVHETGWYTMAASINGGSTLAWVCRILGLTWPELYAAAALPPRNDDPLFLPHLHGERTAPPDQPLLGAWTGLSPRHDRGRLARAALEGVAIAVRQAARSLPVTDDGSSVWLAGGGTVSPPWRQLLCDALGRPLEAVHQPGASGVGAALLGGLAVGLDLPVPTATDRALVAEPRPSETDLLTARADSWERQVASLATRGVR